MEKTITIDGRGVKFRATASIPRMYRDRFGRDIIQDMEEVQKALEERVKDGTAVPPKALEMFENASYIMALAADPETVPETPEEWLDGFGTFSIYQVFPEIIGLWTANMTGTSKPKKK